MGMAFGGLFIKTRRVHRIFNNKMMQKTVITLADISKELVVLLLIDVVILAVWFGNYNYGRLETTQPIIAKPEDPLNTDLERYTLSCSGEAVETFEWIAILKNLFLMVFGAYLAYETREVEIPALNDSKVIGMAIYTSLLISMIIVPLVKFDVLDSDDPTWTFVFSSLAIWLCATISGCIMFLPKIHAIVTGRDVDLVQMTHRSGTSRTYRKSVKTNGNTRPNIKPTATTSKENTKDSN